MLGDQRGFTIIEVLVAATLLVIGVLGTMAMVDSSNAETRLSGGREGATNLAREVVEGARSLGLRRASCLHR
ncbi:MAG: prepilin-type N-terminal cleavage/methylation domain-containing protein [Thermoleophilaceae bacterium]